MMMWIMVLWAFLIVFLTFVFSLLGFLIYELWRMVWMNGMPTISSAWGVVDTVISKRLLPTNGLILDLGAGNGWTLRRFWRHGLHGPLIGYEKEFVPWVVGAVWNRMSGMPVNVVKRDLYLAPFEDAKGIYLFLLPAALVTLAPELKRRCQPGTVIISAEFVIPEWTPREVIEAKGITSRHAKVFVYLV